MPDYIVSFDCLRNDRPSQGQLPVSACSELTGDPAEQEDLTRKLRRACEQTSGDLISDVTVTGYRKV
jgi:hypothetical protein